ncbi:MAG: transcriptional repressor [Opitutae bacterium]|jgi:Fe2+ or Zn2+ uptake regulation protein|nr:transcriptional repressor [Opitutae bacterium]
MSKLVEQAITLLRKEGFRITEQRKAILEVLAKAESPMSADECFAGLTKVKCDLVTIYRCLEQFEKTGIVELGVRENGTRVYCLGHGHEGGHHHHLTCRKCGHAERVDICMGNELEELARGHGFTNITHVMEVFGLCPSCS